MSLHIKDGGSWRTVDQPFVNVGGTWKTVREVHTKHGGTWRKIHTTPYTEYNLGSLVQDTFLGVGDSGTYYIPTGQGIAYIWVEVSGQGGGGGGGAYATEEHFTCLGSGGAFTGNKTGPETGNGGAGGVGGKITTVYPVYDGDYVSWSAYGESGNNGEGGSNAAVNTPLVYNQMSSAGTYTGGTGENGFMTQCNIRNSSGYSKAQLWAGGGRGGTGGTLNFTQKCLQAASQYFGGATISVSNGSTGATGQASNQVVASNAVSLTQGQSEWAGGSFGIGNDAQNNGKIQIKLYTPDKY